MPANPEVRVHAPAEHVRVDARPLRVVLGGWYGAANLGDELLLGIIANWVREAGGVPVAISNHPPYTIAAHGIEAVGYGDLPAIVEAMAAADLFVLGGGGLFQDYDVFDLATLARFPAYTVSQYAQFLLLADELGLPTLALAQGVGPLRAPEGRAIAADICTRASAVSVRDPDSAALLRSIGVERDIVVAPDPGWTWQAAAAAEAGLRERYPQFEGRAVYAMILRDWPFDPAWEAACVEALAASLPPDCGLLWLDFHRPPDATATGHSEIARRVVGKLVDGRTHVVWDGTLLNEAIGLLAQCDACIAMRLHGVLLSCAARVPTVAIEYDAKVSLLCDEIGMPPVQRVGLTSLAVDLPAAIAAVTGGGSARPFRLAPARVAELAAGALAHRDLLWDAMATARRFSSRPAVSSDGSSWLGRWLVHAPAAVPRVVAALTGRLRAQASLQSGRHSFSRD